MIASKWSVSILIAITACAISHVCLGASQPKLDLYGDPLPEGAIARCGTVRFLLRFDTWSLALSPDGKTVAVGNMPGSWPSADVELWDANTVKRIVTLALGSVNTLALAWAPDGRRLAVSHDYRLEIFNAFQGKLLTKLPQLTPSSHCGSSIRWSADGKRLFSHSWNGELCVWDCHRQPSCGRLNAVCNSMVWPCRLTASKSPFAVQACYRSATRSVSKPSGPGAQRPINSCSSLSRRMGLA